MFLLYITAEYVEIAEVLTILGVLSGLGGAKVSRHPRQ